MFTRRRRATRRNAIHVEDNNMLRNAMIVQDVYFNDDDDDFGCENDDHHHVDRDRITDWKKYPHTKQTISSLLDISAELEVRDNEDQWKEEDPWKSTDSLCQLVDQYSKTEEQRKLSSIQLPEDEPSLLKRTWRSSGSLSNLIESTTNSIKKTWKSNDSLSNLVDDHGTKSISHASQGTKFNSATTSQSDNNFNKTKPSLSTRGQSSSYSVNMISLVYRPSTPFPQPGDEIVAGNDILVYENSYYESSVCGTDTSSPRATNESSEVVGSDFVRSLHNLFFTKVSSSSSNKRTLASTSKDSTTCVHEDGTQNLTYVIYSM